MNTTRTMTLTVLALTLLLAVPLLATEELPAPPIRVWAPVGDDVGLGNHATGTFKALDDHGEKAKGAEDWQRLGQTSGEGLFNWHKTYDDSRQMTIRGFGTNEAGAGLNGDLGIWCNRPGQVAWNLDLRGFNHYYDRTSEMRAGSFAAPPAPPELDSHKRLGWYRGTFALRYNLSDEWGMNVGYRRYSRNGAKGSLVRGLTNVGSAPPAIKDYDTTVNEIWVGGGYATGAFASDLKFAYRGNYGTRSLDDRRAYDDDQKLLRAVFDARYDFSTTFRLVGGASASQLDNKGSERWSITDYSMNGKAKTAAGQLGLFFKLGRGTLLRASGVINSQNTKAQSDEMDAVDVATDRDRKSQDYRLSVSNTGLPGTRLHLGYRFKSSDLNEIKTEDGLSGTPDAGGARYIDQNKKSHNVDFKGRYRFGPRAGIKAAVNWHKQDVDQKDGLEGNPADLGDYFMGDRKRDRFGWQLGLQLRPWNTVRLDLGHQSIYQNYERPDLAGSDTKWTANRGYVNINWLAADWLSIYGTASLGMEKYELQNDPTPTTGMGMIAYDGTTTRFIPGASLQLTKRLSLEGTYEAIRFEDDGVASAGLAKLQSDHDRAQVRARYQFPKNLAATASFWRNEFMEHRWDNYIQNIYAISLSGTF